MNLDFIQVDKKGITQCFALARLLKIDKVTALGLGVMLWDWGVKMAPEAEDGTVDFRGLICPTDFQGTSEDVPLLIAAALEYDGDAAALWRALVLVGLCGNTPARIKGLDRYKPFIERRNHDRERKRLYREKQEEKKPKKLSRGNPRDVRGSPGERSHGRPGVDQIRSDQIRSKGGGGAMRPASPPPPPPASELGDWVASKRSDAGFPNQPLTADHATRLNAIVEQVGMEAAQFAYVSYCGDAYWQKRAPRSPIEGFLAQWFNHLPVKEAKPVEPKRSPFVAGSELEAQVAFEERVADPLRKSGDHAYALGQLYQLRPALTPEGTLTLQAEDPYFHSWVADHYADLIAKCGARLEPLPSAVKQGAA